MKNWLSTIIAIVLVLGVMIYFEDRIYQAKQTNSTEVQNSGVSSKYSKNELYYLGTKEIAKKLELTCKSKFHRLSTCFVKFLF